MTGSQSLMEGGGNQRWVGGGDRQVVRQWEDERLDTRQRASSREIKPRLHLIRATVRL